MKGQKYIAGFMTVTMTAISLLTSNVKASYAASPVQLPGTFAISPAANNNMVVDKFGDSVNTAANAHLYDKSNPGTHTLTGDRAANGSYEVHLNSNRNLCLTMAGGLNPNQGNGTLAVFSSNCANSLNLMFMNDNTIRVSRNQNLCLTNQGNRSGTLFNRLHFWACDDSPETKFNWYYVNTTVQNPYIPPVVQQNSPTVQPNTQPQDVFKKAKSNQFRKPDNKYACGPCIFVAGVVFAWAIEKVLDWALVEGRVERVWVHGYVPNYVPSSWAGSEKDCKMNQKNGKLIWYEVEGEGSVKTCVTPYKVIPF
jgi:hypothetical protein